MEWQTFIVTYWAQITVLLTAIGFIIQKFLDYKLRKREVSFDKLRDYKVIELKDYLKSYHALKLAVRDFLHQTEYGEHKDEIFNQNRTRIRDCTIELQYHSLLVKLFLTEEEKKIIDEIEKLLDKGRYDIEVWHIHTKSPLTYDTKVDSDNLRNLEQVIFKVSLPELVDKLAKNLNKDFGITNHG